MTSPSSSLDVADVNYICELAGRLRKFGDDHIGSGGWDRFGSDLADQLDEIAGKLAYALTAIPT